VYMKCSQKLVKLKAPMRNSEFLSLIVTIELLKRVMVMTLDKVHYAYGIRKIPNLSPSIKPQATLEQALDFLSLP